MSWYKAKRPWLLIGQEDRVIRPKPIISKQPNICRLMGLAYHHTKSSYWILCFRHITALKKQNFSIINIGEKAGYNTLLCISPVLRNPDLASAASGWQQHMVLFCKAGWFSNGEDDSDVSSLWGERKRVMFLKGLLGSEHLLWFSFTITSSDPLGNT